MIRLRWKGGGSCMMPSMRSSPANRPRSKEVAQEKARCSNQPLSSLAKFRLKSCQCNKKENTPMKWITREHVKVDRVACPWLIKKFIDKDAQFLFVPTD